LYELEATFKYRFSLRSNIHTSNDYFFWLVWINTYASCSNDYYPQKPLVRSFTYDTLNVHPVGQNVVLAIMPYEGYNMEDATVLNGGSVDRGFGRSSRFRPYVSVELNYAGGLHDEICIPDKAVSDYRIEESYKFLEDDGIVYPEANITNGDVVIGKVSPPKFFE